MDDDTITRVPEDTVEIDAGLTNFWWRPNTGITPACIAKINRVLADAFALDGPDAVDVEPLIKSRIQQLASVCFDDVATEYMKKNRVSIEHFIHLHIQKAPDAIVGALVRALMNRLNEDHYD
jgi:hypothetical protein